jgi:group I intron endonuclease
MIEEKVTQSGIYIIKNKINGHFYLGSSNNMSKRWNRHLNNLRNNLHHSRYLQRAWNHYDEVNFIFQIILICEPFELLRYEQKLLTILKPIYNVSIDAVAPTRGRKLSIETKMKISKSLIGNKRTFGRIRPKKECDAISSKLKGRKIHPNTIQALHNRAKYWGNLVSPDGIIHKDITNLKTFCEKYLLSYGDMYGVFKGKRIQHKGWKLCL